MEYLHLTHRKNIHSILKNGLIPQPILIPEHFNCFNEYGLEKPQCIYLWLYDTYKNGKYSMDMIYTKLFIHPRNNLCDHINEDFSFKNLGSTLYGDDSDYYLLLIEINDNKYPVFKHVQEPDDVCVNVTTTIMADKYAHNDKSITICDSIVLPHKIKIVEKIKTRLYKNNTMGFTFSKTKKGL
jgi:hypothetical protein